MSTTEVEVKGERDVCSFKEYSALHADQVPFVLNTCYGGFRVSKPAGELLKDHHRDDGMISVYDDEVISVSRNSVFLAWLVEEKLRRAANGSSAQLKVQWVPSTKGPFYHILDYHDGYERLCFTVDRFNAFQQTQANCQRLHAIEAALEWGRIDKALKQIQHMRQELTKHAVSLQVMRYSTPAL